MRHLYLFDERDGGGGGGLVGGTDEIASPHVKPTFFHRICLPKYLHSFNISSQISLKRKFGWQSFHKIHIATATAN